MKIILDFKFDVLLLQTLNKKNVNFLKMNSKALSLCPSTATAVYSFIGIYVIFFSEKI